MQVKCWIIGSPEENYNIQNGSKATMSHQRYKNTQHKHFFLKLFVDICIADHDPIITRGELGTH